MPAYPLQFILLGISIVIAFVILLFLFGIEVPLYFALGAGGLFAYAYSENPVLKFAGGWMGRFFIVLSIVALFYYYWTRTFFPDDPFQFKFLPVGINFLNEATRSIGEFVLSLIR